MSPEVEQGRVTARPQPGTQPTAAHRQVIARQPCSLKRLLLLLEEFHSLGVAFVVDRRDRCDDAGGKTTAPHLGSHRGIRTGPYPGAGSRRAPTRQKSGEETGPASTIVEIPGGSVREVDRIWGVSLAGIGFMSGRVCAGALEGAGTSSVLRELLQLLPDGGIEGSGQVLRGRFNQRARQVDATRAQPRCPSRGISPPCRRPRGRRGSRTGRRVVRLAVAVAGLYARDRSMVP
jgi:hypothetical protein